MAIKLPHIEDSGTTRYIEPGEYETFQDEQEYEEKVREWGLSTTKDVKKEFWYKEKTHQRLVTIKGYQTFGETSEYNTLVIEFQDGNLSCIHPAYLKEMQSPSFGKESWMHDDPAPVQKETGTKKAKPVNNAIAAEEKSATIDTKFSASPAKEKTAKTGAAKKEKPKKLDLPGEKVHFSAKVKQLALSWNHFNEENDEVVILEDVRIEQEEPVEVGLAWCSHSKTLKKFELAPGEALKFDGKIVKKSLPKGKDVKDDALFFDGTVSYKINNPSKIVKH